MALSRYFDEIARRLVGFDTLSARSNVAAVDYLADELDRAGFRVALQRYQDGALDQGEPGGPRRARTLRGTPALRARRHGAVRGPAGVPELIEPGHPEQNGRHERMHRACSRRRRPAPARANLLCQQRRFDRFRFEYNEELPHQALQGQSPAMLYARSPRPHPETLPQPEYPAHFEIRKMSRNGGIRWKHSSAVGPKNGWLFITPGPQRGVTWASTK
jgi:hypothetical protein